MYFELEIAIKNQPVAAIGENITIVFLRPRHFDTVPPDR